MKHYLFFIKCATTINTKVEIPENQDPGNKKGMRKLEIISGDCGVTKESEIFERFVL